MLCHYTFSTKKLGISFSKGTWSSLFFISAKLKQNVLQLTKPHINRSGQEQEYTALWSNSLQAPALPHVCPRRHPLSPLNPQQCQYCYISYISFMSVFCVPNVWRQDWELFNYMNKHCVSPPPAIQRCILLFSITLLNLIWLSRFSKAQYWIFNEMKNSYQITSPESWLYLF